MAIMNQIPTVTKNEEMEQILQDLKKVLSDYKTVVDQLAILIEDKE